MKKRNSNRLAAAILSLVAGAAFYNSSKAAEPESTGVLPAEFSQWKEKLRQAGASPDEIRQFEELLRQQSPGNLKAIQEHLRSAPPNFLATYVRGVRQEGTPLYSWNDDPLRDHESVWQCERS